MGPRLRKTLRLSLKRTQNLVKVSKIGTSTPILTDFHGGSRDTMTDFHGGPYLWTHLVWLYKPDFPQEISFLSFPSLFPSSRLFVYAQLLHSSTCSSSVLISSRLAHSLTHSLAFLLARRFHPCCSHFLLSAAFPVLLSRFLLLLVVVVAMGCFKKFRSLLAAKVAGSVK